MTYHARQDETSEWLNYLQPEGLVVGPNILRQRGLTPIRQTPQDTDEAATALGLDIEAPRDLDKSFVLQDPWRFFANVLGWSNKYVAGSPEGPQIPSDLIIKVPEHETLLSPSMAVLWRDDAPEGVPVQALVMIHPDLDADGRNQFADGEWEASPHQRLERLLRETNVGVGILVTRNALRLVYAPRGETAGWLTWPLAALGRVEGRPMLAGLKLCLGRSAFFTGAPETRLRPILEASREAQNEVSEKLSGQVLGALHELLRGLHSAAPDQIEDIAQNQPQHLYEGLLTCLMRLVFLLYAEDRDLLPSSTDPRLKQLWDQGYSIKTLYARLLTDEALNPDTMDERRGAWGQLLAVFRIIHEGQPGWVAARRGKLFDPQNFPFLEGRDPGTDKAAARVLPVSDGTILRILHGLMTIEGRSFSGEKIRERLSYRSLDVESIGSVYETVMGFTTARATEPMIALKDEKKLPTFIGLSTLLEQKPNDRQKWLKENAIKSLSVKQAKGVKEASSVTEIIEAFGTLIDERASPKMNPIGAGTPYLQPTEERRRSGSHYTPRSLTEPIVRHALEPAFERLGEKASPEDVLSLKVLDPACGSGAFLVEACRQLGARLEQAWNMYGAEKPIIPPDEDEALHARRLVAQKCLYGVDRNPMAVDLARLSLWLATLARDHEFTFLDHALKAGDSLVGLTRAEIAAANWDSSKPGLPLFGKMIKEAVEKAREAREAIRNAGDDVLNEAQATRYARVIDVSEPARIVGDAVIAAFFSGDNPKEREAERQKVENSITSSSIQWNFLEEKAKGFRSEQGWQPFHWDVEFPEVFFRENSGFDTIVGNPPFLGGKRISEESGETYNTWLSFCARNASKNADLVAHFARKSFFLLRDTGRFGLIATNTIAQGDTRSVGIQAIMNEGASIPRAIRRMPWPGDAAVVVSVIHVDRMLNGTKKASQPILDGKRVSRISAYLVESDFDANPHRLAANSQKAFIGSILRGMGFTFDDQSRKDAVSSLSEMREILTKASDSAHVIKPFIGGDEVANDPKQNFRRYVIDFSNMSFDECQTKWPELIEVIEKKVKPERDKLGNSYADRQHKSLWWQFANTRLELYQKITKMASVWVHNCGASPHLAFARQPTDRIFAHTLCVFPYSNFFPFSVLQSRVHEIWARFFSSSMKDDLRYAPSDCFETFPFPRNYEIDPALETIGQTYHDHRAQLMIAADEGMTKTYNRFHNANERNEAIQKLREFHDEMDRAVLRAYGWDDLADELRPEFLTEETEDDHTYQGRYFWNAEGRDRVLARLLALNAERHAEEVAAEKATTTSTSKRKKSGEDTQGGLFD
jgi:hypothetical protein